MEPALRRQKFTALDLVLGRNVVAHETLGEGTHRLIVQSRRRELVHDPLKKRPPLALALHDPVSAPQHQGEPAEPPERPSRGDSCLSFAGVSKWEIRVQPEPPEMGETSVERAAFVAFTKEFLRAEFTDAELASMLEPG